MASDERCNDGYVLIPEPFGLCRLSIGHPSGSWENIGSPQDSSFSGSNDEEWHHLPQSPMYVEAGLEVLAANYSWQLHPDDLDVNLMDVQDTATLKGDAPVSMQPHVPSGLF